MTVLRTAFLALAVCLLAACGSTPTSDKQGGAEAGAPPAAARSSENASSALPASPGDAAPDGGVADAPLPPEAAEAFDRAVVLMTSGDVAAAEQALRALVSKYPDYSGPQVNLAILHAKAGRLEEAERTLEAAVERNPNNASAFNQLGIVYRRRGRFDDADAAYQRALALDPNYANAYLNLGVLCDLYLQQPQRALDAFERYLELAQVPDERVNTWVSELKARLGSAQRNAGAQ